MRRFDLLAQLVNAHGWTRGAEIGVQHGKTFFWLLDHCPKLTLIGVDIWEPRPDKSDGWTYIQDNLPRLYMKISARALNYGGRAIVMRAWSVVAAQSIPDESLDFVFIDADHTEEGVRPDIMAWAPKVKKTGWLTGHDYCPEFPGVVKVVDELLPGAKVHSDSVWTIPKAETCFA